MLFFPACPSRRLPHAFVAGLLVFTGAAQAQLRPAPLTGTVRTSAGAAVEYATVTLHRPTDSLALKTEFSDAEGRFQLEPAAAGSYLVSVAQVGYGRAWAGPLEAGAASAPPLVFTLTPSAATQLQGVTVTGQRPQFERLPDRTIVNVEGSPLSAGSTTLDVLGRAPGVRLDGNDNLALRGKQGVLVLLDGKRVPLTGAELATMLQSLPAEQVRSIELITSPPAKYDAQGGAGIIAINLRKDQRLGTNGSLNAAYGRGRYGKFTSGLSLNHRTKSLNLYGSYAYADRQNFLELDFRRAYLQDGRPTRTSVQRNTPRSHLQSHTWRAGADYTLGARTTLGVLVSGLGSRLPSRGDNWAQFYNEHGQLDASFLADNRRLLLTPNVGANVSVRHQFPKDSLGTAELTADVDAARYSLTRTLHLTVTDLLSSLYSPAVLLGDQDGELTIWSAKADYVRPLRHGLRLEAGVKVSQVESDNDVLFERERDGRREVDAGLTNRFRYDENINAAYVILSRTRPGLTVQAGLRGEQTIATGRQEAGQHAALDRSYFQLFPSLSVRRPLSERHELALSLSRRIDRPTYNQLNPFRSYVDPTSYRTGNPVLWPQTSTQVELTHTFRQKLSTALSYTRYARPIVSVYLLDADGLVAATDVNLRAQEHYGLTLTAPLEPAKWWKLYANAELFYIRFQGELAETPPPTARPGAILSLNNSLTLGHGWSADVNGSYNSPERYAYQDLRSFGQLGLGVQKSLGPATLRLNATDLLYTQPLRVTSRYRVLEERFRSAQDTRVVTASLTYRFGSEKVAAARKRATSAEDEKRRAASGLQ
ncbi:TonB-dependent receptor [Hymenobacter weizhouensis]|uniref:TonB-dependent receptor n=1 Tax=Hymenobacter sp. YIM 151500-1 TaxID=2987689 RepID=UPI002226DF41|nr:TonB-dependent receptor [Hymenobacter sp. YIM 151500-1]UYZ64298.1 TonB-dependent receptor [Hymenobacter sp. YIM 151500-1]